MADWDEEDFEPAVPGLATNQPKTQWDDEDVEDAHVKESWEDEEDTVEAPKPEQEAKTTASKAGAKSAGKKDKLPEAKTSNVADDVLADPVAEKLRQQRLVEESDYKSTAELFARKGDQKTLDNFIPKSENDFLEYAELLSYKICPHEVKLIVLHWISYSCMVPTIFTPHSLQKSFHYIGLLKAILRLSMTSLKAADAKEVAASASAIANEKLKAEKEANAGKKKQGAKKKQLHVDKADDDYSATDGYDGVDDYDFM
ncbi:eukaryotic translation initiation factor 3 subunit J-like isoform X1 [Zingiber officinale]|uniref:eukaryotic translation initiation factor 3 subunit J-like isoform X1 n=1 Tax=Zingiber officinale TaxID=94328 RepID=UPI001C4D4B72|nr:eukaryotic translation initiation factor 3 subunit J-like isoform X1 [Zingiber officinale]